MQKTLKIPQDKKKKNPKTVKINSAKLQDIKSTNKNCFYMLRMNDPKQKKKISLTEASKVMQ